MEDILPDYFFFRMRIWDFAGDKFVRQRPALLWYALKAGLDSDEPPREAVSQ